MTTEEPTATRVLRRRSDDRVIAGVASGLGDFLNVDPLLIRIGFVGLMVFGGLGLVLYVVAWLAVADEATDESIAEQLLERAGLNTSRFLVGLLLLIGAFLFIGGLGNAVAYSSLAIGIGAALVVIVLGAVILRQDQRDASVRTPPRAKARQSDAPPAASVEASARPRWRLARRRRRRTRSPLAGYVLGAVLAGVGILAIATNVAGADVDLGQFFGLALGIIGIGLVVGARWGGARRLILLGLLLVPLGIGASFITVPIEGGIGDHRFSPTSVGELRDEYRLAVGQLWLDLRHLEAGDEPIEIVASVAVGELIITLPEEPAVEVAASVGAGGMGILGAWQSGTALADRHLVDGSGARFILDLDAGVGGIGVDTRPDDWR